jgi:hypothetical protein
MEVMSMDRLAKDYDVINEAPDVFEVSQQLNKYAGELLRYDGQAIRSSTVHILQTIRSSEGCFMTIFLI